MTDELKQIVDRLRKLAERPSDDEEPATEEWLRRVWFLPDGDASKDFARKIWNKGDTEDYGKEPAMHVLVTPEDGSVWIEAYSKGGETLSLIELNITATRGNVRRLCLALGIQLKEQARPRKNELTWSQRVTKPCFLTEFQGQERYATCTRK